MIRGPLRRRQHGVVFYLFVVFALMTMAALLAGVGGLLDHRSVRARHGEEILAQARALLLAELAQPELWGSANRPGQWFRFPDLPIPVGGGLDASEPNYDGRAELAGCATRTWVPGQALVPVAVSGSAARCFGRLHWLDIGLNVDGDPQTDPAGQVPWVVFSPNLAAASACLPNLNPLMSSAVYGGYACPSALPYPWLTVVDGRGNIVSDRVAFAVILPGPPLAGQVRGVGAPVAAWLDRLDVSAACAQPCRPGRYDNALYAHPDGQPTVLVQAPAEGPRIERGTNFDLPHAFNDRLVYVTVDELLESIEARARAELLRALAQYRSANGHYPYAAAFGSANGDCVDGLRFGHPALAAGNCGAARFATMPAWFGDGGWHRYFAYAVSPRCNSASAGCGAPGLRVDARNDVDALLISPGAAITRAPFAPALGIAQIPLLPGLLPSGNAADYLDAFENVAGTPDVFVRTPPGSGADNDRLYTLP